MSLYRKLTGTFLKTSFGTHLILNVASRLDPHILRATNGRLSLGSFLGYPTLMLTTTGRKSGLPRPVTLVYTLDEDRLVLVASNGGTAKNPAWYNNLKATPQAHVLLHQRSGLYTAHEATNSEYGRLWQLISANYAGYDTYQSRTERHIPIMVLKKNQ